MNLSVDQAKRVARGQATMVYLPVPPKDEDGIRHGWTPKTGRSEPVQSRNGAKVTTHCRVVIGLWQETTLRPLLDHKARRERALAGWAHGDSRIQMADEWMRRYDASWPPTTRHRCVECDEGLIYFDHVLPLPDHPAKDCVRCHSRAIHLQHSIRCAVCNGTAVLRFPAAFTVMDTLDRFERRWADRPVYAVIVSLDDVAPARHLSPAGRRAGSDARGYTSGGVDALDAGIVPPDAWVDAQARKIAEKNEELREERRREHGRARAQRWRDVQEDEAA